MAGITHGLLGLEWTSYARSELVERNIQLTVWVMGWLYVLSAIAALFIHRIGKVAVVLLYIGGGALIFLALLYCKEKFFHSGQFFE